MNEQGERTNRMEGTNEMLNTLYVNMKLTSR